MNSEALLSNLPSPVLPAAAPRGDRSSDQVADQGEFTALLDDAIPATSQAKAPGKTAKAEGAAAQGQRGQIQASAALEAAIAGQAPQPAPGLQRALILHTAPAAIDQPETESDPEAPAADAPDAAASVANPTIPDPVIPDGEAPDPMVADATAMPSPEAVIVPAQPEPVEVEPAPSIANRDQATPLSLASTPAAAPAKQPSTPKAEATTKAETPIAEAASSAPQPADASVEPRPATPQADDRPIAQSVEPGDPAATASKSTAAAASAPAQGSQLPAEATAAATTPQLKPDDRPAPAEKPGISRMGGETRSAATDPQPREAGSASPRDIRDSSAKIEAPSRAPTAKPDTAPAQAPAPAQITSDAPPAQFTPHLDGTAAPRADTGIAQALHRAGVTSHPAAEQVATEIRHHVQGGDQRFVIRLDPPELGRVEVHLSMKQDHSVQAYLTADNHDALDALQRDIRVLERALQDAGLKTDSGSLNFSLRQGHDGAGRPPWMTGDATPDFDDDAPPAAPPPTRRFNAGLATRPLDLVI